MPVIRSPRGRPRRRAPAVPGPSCPRRRCGACLPEARSAAPTRSVGPAARPPPAHSGRRRPLASRRPPGMRQAAARALISRSAVQFPPYRVAPRVARSTVSSVASSSTRSRETTAPARHPASRPTTAARSSRSRLLVGSFSSRTSGSANTRAASPTRARRPPESAARRAPDGVLRPRRPMAATRASRSQPVSFSSPSLASPRSARPSTASALVAPNRSAIVSPGAGCTAWRSTATRPLTETRPERGRGSPETTLSRAVLPTPLRPTRPVRTGPNVRPGPANSAGAVGEGGIELGQDDGRGHAGEASGGWVRASAADLSAPRRPTGLRRGWTRGPPGSHPRRIGVADQRGDGVFGRKRVPLLADLTRSCRFPKFTPRPVTKPPVRSSVVPSGRRRPVAMSPRGG